MRRLFLALPLPGPVGVLVAEAVARCGVAEAGFRTVPAGDLHLTLRFLGATPEAQIGGLEERVRTRVADLPAPELELAQAGAFPAPGRPRVLWVGVRESARTPGAPGAPSAAGALGACVRAVEEAAVAAGFPLDPRASSRRSAAHVTVARPRAGGRVATPEAFLRCAPSARWTANEIVLFESRPGRAAGERYVARASFDLVLDPGR